MYCLMKDFLKIGGVGATAVADAREDVPAWVRARNDGRGADIIFVCAGAKSALEQALQSVDRGGTVMFFAVPGPGTELAVTILGERRAARVVEQPLYDPKHERLFA